MDLLFVVLITLGIGVAAGAIGVHYIHNVASAATRAVTIPSGQAATVAAYPVVGPMVGTASTDLIARIAALEAKLGTSVPMVTTTSPTPVAPPPLMT
jgi:hypothetical protein